MNKILPWIAIGLSIIALGVVLLLTVPDIATRSGGGNGWCKIASSDDPFDRRFDRCAGFDDWEWWCPDENFESSDCIYNDGAAGSQSSGGSNSNQEPNGTCWIGDSSNLDGVGSTLSECLNIGGANQWCLPNFPPNDPNCEFISGAPDDETTPFENNGSSSSGPEGLCVLAGNLPPSASFDATTDFATCSSNRDWLMWCENGVPNSSTCDFNLGQSLYRTTGDCTLDDGQVLPDRSMPDCAISNSGSPAWVRWCQYGSNACIDNPD